MYTFTERFNTTDDDVEIIDIKPVIDINTHTDSKKRNQRKRTPMNESQKQARNQKRKIIRIQKKKAEYNTFKLNVKLTNLRCEDKMQYNRTYSALLLMSSPAMNINTTQMVHIFTFVDDMEKKTWHLDVVDNNDNVICYFEHIKRPNYFLLHNFSED